MSTEFQQFVNTIRAELTTPLAVGVEQPVAAIASIATPKPHATVMWKLIGAVVGALLAYAAYKVFLYTKQKYTRAGEESTAPHPDTYTGGEQDAPKRGSPEPTQHTRHPRVQPAGVQAVVAEIEQPVEVPREVVEENVDDDDEEETETEDEDEQGLPGLETDTKNEDHGVPDDDDDEEDEGEEFKSDMAGAQHLPGLTPRAQFSRNSF